MSWLMIRKSPRIAQYEMAFMMQASVPEVMDVKASHNILVCRLSAG
jgi:hypothetical protein